MNTTMLLILFIISQLTNVILSTIKLIATVKFKPFPAAVINALSYTAGNIVTLLLVKQNVYLAIIITFISNLIGVPLGRFIIDKFSNDRLFIFTATIKGSIDLVLSLKEYLKEFEIHLTWQEITEGMYRVDIYSSSKSQSNIIREKLCNINCKYHVIEAH